jgi:hypothetical protein
LILFRLFGLKTNEFSTKNKSFEETHDSRLDPIIFDPIILRTVSRPLPVKNRSLDNWGKSLLYLDIGYSYEVN